MVAMVESRHMADLTYLAAAEPSIRGVLRDLGKGQLGRPTLDAGFDTLQQFGTRVPAGSAPFKHLAAARGSHCDRLEQIGGGAVAAALRGVSPLFQERTGRRI